MGARVAAVLLLCGAGHALAEDAGLSDAGLEDGGLPSFPDASVAEGGADRDNPEGEDQLMNTTCSLDRDCSANFRCADGRCTYSGPRQASGPSCLGGAAAVMLPLGLGLFINRRRRP